MIDKNQLIEKYFENQLCHEEQLLFDELMTNDLDFQNEINFEKQLKVAITLNERDHLKDVLQGFEKNNPKSTVKPFIQKWLGIAASFVIILGAALLIMMNNHTNEELYSTYFQSYPNTVSPTVRGEVSSDLISQAFYYYDNENYEEAIKLFDEIYREETLDYALFYKGLSQMELQQINEAMMTFKTFDFNSKGEYNEQISWYLALCYIKNEQKEKARPLLKSITNSENQFKKSASELLNLLK